MCGSNTSTTTSGPPTQFLEAYDTVLDQAYGVAGAPLQQYDVGPNGENVVAGFTPYQQQGFDTFGDIAGVYEPYLGMSGDYMISAATPWTPQYQFAGAEYLPGMGFDAYGDAMAYGAAATAPVSGYDTLSTYFNPYQEEVIDTTAALFNEQNAEKYNDARGNAAAMGAFGGDREAVMASEMARQQSLAQDPILADLRVKGFTGAQDALYEQQKREIAERQLALGAAGIAGQTGAAYWGEYNRQALNAEAHEQAERDLGMRAGYGLGNLGQLYQSLGQSEANAFLGAGAQQQALNQQYLNVPYQQFMQRQAYPFQTTGWLANIATGLGGSAGGTSSTTYPGPSTFGTIAGLGTAGVGALGATGAFGSSGWLTGSSTPTYSPSYNFGSTSTFPVFDPGFTWAADGGRIQRGLGGLVDDKAPRIDSEVPDLSVSPVPGASGLGTAPAKPGGGGMTKAFLQPVTTQTQSSGGGLSQILGTALKLVPLFLKDGGAAYASGGSAVPDLSESPIPGASGLGTRPASSGGGSLNQAFMQPVTTKTQSGGGGGALGAIGSIAGTIVGGPVGGMIGGTVGRAIGSQLADGGVPVPRGTGLGVPDLARSPVPAFQMPAGRMGPPPPPAVPQQAQKSPLDDIMKSVQGLSANWNKGTQGGSGSSSGALKYDLGGSVPQVGLGGGDPIQQQALMQRYGQMPPDKLRDLSMRFPPGTPQGQALQRMMAGPQTSSYPGGAYPAGPFAGSMPSAAARGGRMGLADGGGRLRFYGQDQARDAMDRQLPDAVANSIANLPSYAEGDVVPLSRPALSMENGLYPDWRGGGRAEELSAQMAARRQHDEWNDPRSEQSRAAWNGVPQALNVDVPLRPLPGLADGGDPLEYRMRPLGLPPAVARSILFNPSYAEGSLIPHASPGARDAFEAEREPSMMSGLGMGRDSELMRALDGTRSPERMFGLADGGEIDPREFIEPPPKKPRLEPPTRGLAAGGDPLEYLEAPAGPVVEEPVELVTGLAAPPPVTASLPPAASTLVAPPRPAASPLADAPPEPGTIMSDGRPMHYVREGGGWKLAHGAAPGDAGAPTPPPSPTLADAVFSGGMGSQISAPAVPPAGLGAADSVIPTIKKYEADGLANRLGINPYYIGWGGADLSQAPLDQYGFPIWEGKMGPAGNSRAAGAYQFQPGTWRKIAVKHFGGYADWRKPEVQDAMARRLYLDQGIKPWSSNKALLSALGTGQGLASPIPDEDTRPGLTVEPLSGGSQRPSPSAGAGGDEKKEDWRSSPWMALIAAGAGMLASRSPHAGVALGEGLETGLKFMGQQQDRDNKAELSQVRAQSISQQAAHMAEKLDLMRTSNEQKAKQAADNLALQQDKAAAQAQHRAAEIAKDLRALEEKERHNRLSEADRQEKRRLEEELAKTKRDAEARQAGAGAWQPGEGTDDEGKRVPGMWHLPKTPDPNKPQGGAVFHPGISAQKQSLAVQAFDHKRKIWLQLHPNDEAGAADFAAGRKTLGTGEYARLVQSQERMLQKAWSDNLQNIGKPPPNFRAQAEQTVRGILGGAPTPGAAPAAPAAGAKPAAPALPPEARSQLKEGVVTTFGNGQKWTLRNGLPVQVP